MLLALVYEVSGNPLFSASADAPHDRLSEFAQPSEIDDLINELHSFGHETILIDGPHDLQRRRDEIRSRGAYVFNKSIGFSGLERKIHVPSICLLYDLPMIGSSAYGMTLARHKYHTNRLLAGLGYRVPAATLWEPGREVRIDNIRGSLVVKPNHESDSIGIDEESIVTSATEAVRRAQSLYERFRQPIVIEEFIPGEEWKVAVIGNSPEPHAWGCVAVCRDGRQLSGSLQTRADVVGHTLSYHPTPSAHQHDAMRIACQVHRDLGLRDYSRCDFRIDGDGLLRCMEISTHPDLSSSSSFMAAATLRRKTVAEVLDAIISVAKCRHEIRSDQSLQN